MTEAIAYRKPGHKWTRWVYSWPRRRWYRHCTRGWHCTAVESAARGHKPKTSRGKK